MSVSRFINTHYRHFNSASLKHAAHAYKSHIENDGLMLVSLAGAMSTAELGVSLAEMIRQNKVHAISCTGANLEEDLYRLLEGENYKHTTNYRDLTPSDEQDILDQSYSRVTDTCIPISAFSKLNALLRNEWNFLSTNNQRMFPHEVVYKLITDGHFSKDTSSDPKNSWLLAACEKNLPIYVPGWEDSTSGNHFAACCMKNSVSSPTIIRSGMEYMMDLATWYQTISSEKSIGFFQIGGGIAGDFAICVVPMIIEDLKTHVNPWGYFCQISDSTMSYGSYSGADPNEKISWAKLTPKTPRFLIESDATIVAPLIFSYVLDQ